MSKENLKENLNYAARAKSQELGRAAVARAEAVAKAVAKAEESLETHSKLLKRAGAIMRDHEAVTSTYESNKQDARLRNRLAVGRPLVVTHYTDWLSIPLEDEHDEPLTAQLLVHTPYSRLKIYEHLRPFQSAASIEVVFRNKDSVDIAGCSLGKDVESVRADKDSVVQASFLHGNPDSVKDSLQLIEGALGIVQDS